MSLYSDIFYGLTCIHDEHAKLDGLFRGVSRRRLAQSWPQGLVDRVLEGIVAVTRQRRGSRTLTMLTDSVAYTARICPKEAIFDCPGCVKRLHQYDVRHSRKDSPPELCRFWDVDPRIYECPACQQGLGGDHPDHARQPSECRAPSVRQAGLRRNNGPIRYPAKKANGDGNRNLHSDNVDLYRDVEAPTASSASREEKRHERVERPPLFWGKIGGLVVRRKWSRLQRRPRIERPRASICS